MNYNLHYDMEDDEDEEMNSYNEFVSDLREYCEVNNRPMVPMPALAALLEARRLERRTTPTSPTSSVSESEPDREPHRVPADYYHELLQEIDDLTRQLAAYGIFNDDEREALRRQPRGPLWPETPVAGRVR
eukprot:9760046-Heterocapsa_arctica.AAC.1